MKTKIISVITAICLLLSVMTLFASAAGEKGMISVGSVSAKVGEKVTVPVKMEKNPGILAIFFSVTYDKDVLTYDSVNYSGKLFSKDEIEINSDLSGEVVIALMTSSLTEDVTGDGNIIDVVFTVNKNATNGTYPLTAAITSSGNMSGQAVNASSQLVDFDFTNGTITVSGGKDAPKTEAPKTAAAQQNATVESVVSYVQTEANGQPVTDEKGQSVTATSKVYVPAGAVAGADNNAAGGENNDSDQQLSNVPDIANETNGGKSGSSSGNVSFVLGTGVIVAIILIAAAIILCVVAVVITKKRNSAGNAQNAADIQPSETNVDDKPDSENKE